MKNEELFTVLIRDLETSIIHATDQLNNIKTYFDPEAEWRKIIIGNYYKISFPDKRKSMKINIDSITGKSLYIGYHIDSFQSSFAINSIKKVTKKAIILK